MNNVKMLYFDRINVSEGTDVNKTSKSKEYVFFSVLVFLKQRDQVSTICMQQVS